MLIRDITARAPFQTPNIARSRLAFRVTLGLILNRISAMTPSPSPPSNDRPEHPAQADDGAPTAPAATWIPIRTLSPKHRPAMLAHLTELSARDRYLRFGYSATDEQIARYIDGIHFERDEVFGVFNRRLVLIALAHLACPDNPEAASQTAEFGGSVAEHVRGRGYGARLFEHAMLHARNRGLSTLFIHALSENTAMLKIARHAGATVERSGTESDAYLKLPEDTMASQVEQWVGQQAAALDYQFKQQAQVMDGLLDVIGEVKAQIGKLNGQSAKD